MPGSVLNASSSPNRNTNGGVGRRTWSTGSARRSGTIVETEAYAGPDDRASHARSGPGGRARLMWGEAGIAYVYLIYGMYDCLNAVTEREGYPGAVLLRAVDPIEGIDGRTDGP